MLLAKIAGQTAKTNTRQANGEPLRKPTKGIKGQAEGKYAAIKQRVAFQGGPKIELRHTTHIHKPHSRLPNTSANPMQPVSACAIQAHENPCVVDWSTGRLLAWALGRAFGPSVARRARARLALGLVAWLGALECREIASVAGLLAEHDGRRTTPKPASLGKRTREKPSGSHKDAAQARRALVDEPVRGRFSRKLGQHRAKASRLAQALSRAAWRPRAHANSVAGEFGQMS